MKNIHVLPTEKPSILYAKDNNYKLANSTMAMDWYISSAGYKPYNIYITSDEEIEKGYVISYGVVIKVMMFDKETLYFVNGTKAKREQCKKIILTTDQDLIKDGVQAIDDEFLEWFVKNPSREEVDLKQLFKDDFGFWVSYLDLLQNEPLREVESKYKIIIPKEEPKQDLEKEMFDLEQELDIPSNLRWHNSKPKQETLEEAAEKWIENKYKEESLSFLDCVEFGAKWQQEQIGKSEFLQKLRATISDAEARRLIFEQFKNK